MTLYLNKNVHPYVYKSKTTTRNMSNQTVYRSNYLNDFIKEQGNLNNRLFDSFEEVRTILKNSNSEQRSKLETLLKRLGEQETLTNQFIDYVKKQELPVQNIIERLDKLDSKSEELAKKLEMDGLIDQAIMDQLSFQSQSTDKFSRKLEVYETTYQDLIVQQRNQTDLYEDIDNKLKVQEAFHETIMNELSHQKEITQKLYKQLDNLKGFIVEKVAPFIEKFDGIITRSGAFQRFIINSEKKGNKEHVTKE
jgi:hypothetical protein